MIMKTLAKPPFSLMAACLAAALSGCASPGIHAAVHGDAAGLQKVLDQPEHGHESLEALMANSMAFDCAECVGVLLKAGAKPDPALLGAAAVAGREKIAFLLVDAGADPAAAMTAVHARTRKWATGDKYSPEQAQSASDLLRRIERLRPEAAVAAAPAPPVPPSPAPPASSLTPAFRQVPRPDDYAVVVGVETYDGLPPAAYAERDAAAAAEFVKALGVPSRNVVSLTGGRATLAGLAKTLEGWLAENVDAASTVYFYFSGRGAADPKSGLAYLVPADGDTRYLEQTAYPLKRAYAKLGALKAKRVVVILEAGFPAAPDAGFNSADGKLALLAAADGGQDAGFAAEKGYGLFSGLLFESLNGAGVDASRRATLKSLFDLAKAGVVESSRRAGREQTPQFRSGGTATDDFLPLAP